MKIATLQTGTPGSHGGPGAGICDDCHRTARLEIAFSKRVIRLCPRCAAYLASTLLARIDEMRHDG